MFTSDTVLGVLVDDQEPLPGFTGQRWLDNFADLSYYIECDARGAISSPLTNIQTKVSGGRK